MFTSQTFSTRTGSENQLKSEQDMFQVLDPQKIKSLEKWLQKTNTTLKQVNGQRRYGAPPPGWKGPPPGPGCEVFIGHIPRDMYEDQLIPLFQSVAPLYEFRLMMNFSGQNRGFAYAKYGDADSAAATIRALNSYPVQNGVRISVRKSTEKRLLCLSDLPPSVECNELLSVLRQIADGVERVTMSATGPKGMDVTALVLYSSHYAASMAKKILVQAFRNLYAISISVQWMTGNAKFRHFDYDKETPRVPPAPNPMATPNPMAVSPLTQPRFHLSQDSEDPPALPTPCSPRHSQAFSKAEGCATPPMSAMLTPEPSIMEGPLHNSVHLLHWLCELHGFGVPIYKMRLDHTGSDGFLYFAYRVVVPGLATPFHGFVHILPTTSADNMEAEVRRAIAKHLLTAMWQAKK